MESNEVRLVWITMLAMCDRFGRVWASLPGLAHRARVPVEAAQQAIERFLAPDPHSRTKDHDGRRIEGIDGGWRLLNHAKYRDSRDPEARREYQRKWDRTKRKRPTKSDQIRPEPTHTNSYANADKSKPIVRGKPRTSKDVNEQPEFVSWYTNYPRKQGRKAAWKEWQRLNGSISAPELMAALKRQILPGGILAREPKFIPLPATYLRGERWQDEAEGAAFHRAGSAAPVNGKYDHLV